MRANQVNAALPVSRPVGPGYFPGAGGVGAPG